VRLLIAIALLFSLTPGMSEVAEAAAHLIVHADLPHHSDEPGHEAEHNCTPLAHHCGCHATMAAQTAVRIVDATAICSVTHLGPGAIDSVFCRSCEPPPLRPPIA